MRKRTSLFPAAIVGLLSLWLLSGFHLPPVGQPFNLAGFGRLPSLNGGRIKPLDTVGRTALLVLRGKQTVRDGDRTLSAIEWLTEMLFRPARANDYKVFEIDDPDVLGMMGIQQTTNRYYSFKELHPYLQAIEQQAAQAERNKSETRSRFQRGILALENKLVTYQRLQNSVQLAGATNVSTEYRYFTAQVIPNSPKEAGPFLSRYRFLNEVAEFYPLPGSRGLNKEQWVSVGQGLLDVLTGPRLHPGVAAFAALGDSYRAEDSKGFNAAVDAYTAWLGNEVPGETRKASLEIVFNHFEPFYKSIVLYLLVFLFIALSWLFWPKINNRTAFLVLLLAFAIHTGGLLSRMALQGRPPVTNLYSSAIFVGWAAVLLGIILERLYRNGMGSLVASTIGFLTLIIAHQLMNQGDTLEMMRAVLDSNFWLATHVVSITIGYSSTFLAGTLATVYVLRRAFDRTWGGTTAASLDRMVYGIVCFSLLFSFIGTILGGIWADQSWGRFWGWDPKENGALMIVLWNAFVLHARLGGMANQRTLMNLAIVGNIVTAFSWFGVNMLGIGLHSYGFMEKAFVWLVVFAVSQLVIIGIGLLPDYMTRRFAPERR